MEPSLRETTSSAQCSETQWLVGDAGISYAYAGKRDCAKIVRLLLLLASRFGGRGSHRWTFTCGSRRSSTLQPPAPPSSTVPREQQQVCPATSPDRVRPSSRLHMSSTNEEPAAAPWLTPCLLSWSI